MPNNNTINTRTLQPGQLFAWDEGGFWTVCEVTRMDLASNGDDRVWFRSFPHVDTRGDASDPTTPAKEDYFWVNDYPETCAPPFTGVAAVKLVSNAKTGKVRTVRKAGKTHQPGCRYAPKPGATKRLPERADPWNNCLLPEEIETTVLLPSIAAITCKHCSK